jgi:Acetoacetate decarboxylase (ADC)
VTGAGGFERNPRDKYEMPVVFGPTEIPDLTTWTQVDMVSVSFVTTSAAARPLVPAVLDVPDRPVVTVSRMTYTGVDYLGGRGYNEVTVGIAATLRQSEATLRGSFMPVVWVDDFRPIIIGREYMGYAKLGAQFGLVRSGDDSRSYDLHEYSTPLLQGEVTDAVPLEGDELETARAAAAVTVFGWKHIAGPQGTVDADYLTSTPLKFVWKRVMRGRGRISFETPDWAAAPHSARILRALASLPVEGACRGLIAVGSGSLNRMEVSRLDGLPAHRPVGADS